MTLEDQEPILFAQALLQQEAAGTALEGLAFRVGRLEVADVPPVILLENAGELRDGGVAMFLPARVAVTAYGETEDDAILLYRAISNLFHRRRRTVINGIVMAGSFDETGLQPKEEPNTNWSARFGVMALYMPDVKLTGLGS